MAAIDGFRFHSIVKSDFIRTYLREKGYTPPCVQNMWQDALVLSSNVSKKTSKTIYRFNSEWY